MNNLLVTIAAAALIAIPVAAHAQDGAGYRTYGQGHVARPATAHARDADARMQDRRAWRSGAVRYGSSGRRGFDTHRFHRQLGARGFYRADRLGARGDVALGFGVYPYGGYAYASPYDGYGGYYDDGAYPYAGYGADYAYSYPDEYGTYQPFDYGYSPGDDAYYAQTPDEAEGPYVAEAAPYGGDEGYQPPPDEGWSAGGPPADCGEWVWREGRGAYEWAPAPCSYPGD